MYRKLLYCLLLVSVFSLTACNGFKKAQGNGQTSTGGLDPISGKKKNKKDKNNSSNSTSNTRVSAQMETIEWAENAAQAPPITSAGVNYEDTVSPETTDSGTETPTGNEAEDSTTPSSAQFGSYNVSILLPFLADQFNTNGGRVFEKSKLAINMYGGMKMAFKKLESEGVRLNVSVFDTKGTTTGTNSVLARPELKTSQLIIGPVSSGNLKKAAQFSLQNKIPLASPVSPSRVVSSDNPYYLQVSPSLESHCKAITQHIRAKHAPDQVVLIVRDKSAEKNRLRYFQNANAEIEGNGQGTRFKEYIIPEISPDYSNIDVTPYLSSTGKTVFVIPSWSSESFINNLLRVLRIVKSRHDIVVYGMPKWMEYEKISYDYYEALNVHVSSDTYLDPTSMDVQSFRKNYYNEYGEAPSEHAFLGYDVMLYMGRLLKEKGTQFQQTIDQEVAQYLHTKFAFEPVSATGNIENFSIRQYENKHVNILQFRDYFFQKAY